MTKGGGLFWIHQKKNERWIRKQKTNNKSLGPMKEKDYGKINWGGQKRVW